VNNVPSIRYTLTVEVTLPGDAFSGRYVSELAAAVEKVRPDLEGQDTKVCFKRAKKAKGSSRDPNSQSHFWVIPWRRR
jgi:hypothetical protein